MKIGKNAISGKHRIRKLQTRNIFGVKQYNFQVQVKLRIGTVWATFTLHYDKWKKYWKLTDVEGIIPKDVKQEIKKRVRKILPRGSIVRWRELRD